MIYWGLTKSDGGGPFSKFIDHLTGGGGYSHAFLWLPDLRLVLEAHIKFGVRPRDRRPDPASELLFEFPNLTPARERDVMRAAVSMLGNGYDAAGAVHLYCNRVKENPRQQFCSEFDVLSGQGGQYWPAATACNVSPNLMRGLEIEPGVLPTEVVGWG